MTGFMRRRVKSFGPAQKYSRRPKKTPGAYRQSAPDQPTPPKFRDEPAQRSYRVIVCSIMIIRLKTSSRLLSTVLSWAPLAFSPPLWALLPVPTLFPSRLSASQLPVSTVSMWECDLSIDIDAYWFLSFGHGCLFRCSFHRRFLWRGWLGCGSLLCCRFLGCGRLGRWLLLSRRLGLFLWCLGGCFGLYLLVELHGSRCACRRLAWDA